MSMIIIGLLGWALIHLSTALAPSIKINLTAKFGPSVYKLMFAILIVSSLVLMVLGWRQAIPTQIYDLPEELRYFNIVLMLFACIFFVSPKLPTRIKTVVRHPQLTSIILWALAHLLTNGDNRSLILFGGMGLWALLEIFCINKRDGAWQVPAAPPLIAELKPAVIGLIVFLIFFTAHPYLSGVSLL